MSPPSKSTPETPRIEFVIQKSDLLKELAMRGEGPRSRVLHGSGPEALRVCAAVAGWRNHHKAARQTLGRTPQRSLSYSDGRLGARELSGPPAVSSASCNPNSGGVFGGYDLQGDCCCLAEGSRYTLRGVLLVIKPESMTMVATDGTGMAHIDMACKMNVSGEIRVMILRKAMGEIHDLLNANDVDTVGFAKNESTLFFNHRHSTSDFPTTDRELSQL
jgi:hypothetical protein